LEIALGHQVGNANVLGVSCTHGDKSRIVKQAAQRGCRCPIPGGVQGLVGWGPGQPGLVLDVEVGGPACGWGVEIHDP